jgi:hypothetical protein
MEERNSAMAVSKDPMASISVHRSTLHTLQDLRTGAVTWDLFLERVAALHEDTVTPELRSELRRRSRRSRVSLREVLRQHEERKGVGR